MFTSIPKYALVLLFFLIGSTALAFIGLANAKENLFRQHPGLAWMLPIALVAFVVLLPLFQILAMVLGVLIVVPLQIGGLVLMGLGLARMHRTDPWRGLLAVFAPLVVMCCCLMVLWFGFIAAIVLPQALK